MDIKKVIAGMSLEEKIALCSGADFWHTKEMKHHGIPSMMMADGPHGLRKQEVETDMLGVNQSVPATSFPTAVSTGCSWDEKLLEEIGEAISKEAIANNVSIVLGPGANIKRNPLCGRNFEYFSEDPYLTGKLAASFIRGAESLGGACSLKHFAFNNQEYKRFSSDSIMDERTMREIYLTGFEIAVKEGAPSAVMSAYNKINGVHCSESKLLLTDILRLEWGFDGMVLTDWGGMSDRIKSFAAGCDLCMPGGSAYMEKEAALAVENGKLSEADIDRSVERVLRMSARAERAGKKRVMIDMEKHHQLAKKAAEESAVLMKNEGGILPLSSSEGVVFIGYMAEEIRYQGAGSSHINPWKLTSVTKSCPEAHYIKGCDEKGNTTQEQLLEASNAAGNAKTVVVFAGLTASYESEGFDRDDLKMPQGHIRLIETVAAANPNTVVVLMCGSPVELVWEEKVKSILYMGLPGQAGGEAIKNLLFGEAVPGGRLAESWPVKYEDCVCSSYYANNRKDAHYREGIYVGYRYYATSGIQVKYPFGHGLSYTEFQYSDLEIQGMEVSVRVFNQGNYAAQEVVQLYLTPPQSSSYRPVKELKAFQKIYLKPGESQKVTMILRERSFAIWDQGWIVPAGTYTVSVGSSSEDLCLSKQIEIDGEEISEKDITPYWYKNPKGVPSQEEWEKLLKSKVLSKVLKKGEFTMDHTVMEMKEYSMIMKIMYKAIEATVAKGFDGKKDYNNPEFRMMINSAADASLSGMKISGGMRNYVLEGMLEMANGHFFKGIRQMMKKY